MPYILSSDERPGDASIREGYSGSRSATENPPQVQPASNPEPSDTVATAPHRLGFLHRHHGLFGRKNHKEGKTGFVSMPAGEPGSIAATVAHLTLEDKNFDSTMVETGQDARGNDTQDSGAGSPTPLGVIPASSPLFLDGPSDASDMGAFIPSDSQSPLVKQAAHHRHPFHTSHDNDNEQPSRHHHPDHLKVPHTKEEREAALIEAHLRAIPARSVPDRRIFSPPLSIKCGPLLRYTGLRRDSAPVDIAHPAAGEERETWRGSMMIVTTDDASDYSTRPFVRLFYINNDSTENAGEDQTGEARSSDRRPKFVSGEKAGKYRQVEALKLHAERGVTFWRFTLEIELSDTESKIGYRINRGPEIFFWVPAKGQAMNIMFHSCNGFSLSVDPNSFCGPDPLWRDALNHHQEKPFHVMLGGGDQVYNDSVEKTTTHFQNWLAIKSPPKKYSHEFTAEMAEELENFYLERYSMWFAQGLFGVANSQIPMINIWDDHDIIDGYGSYGNHFNRCPVFTGLGTVAFKYYMLFQHQSAVTDKEMDEPSWILGTARGPYIAELSHSTFMFLGRPIAFLGLDCRTERMRDIVVSPATYEKVFSRLRKEVKPGETKHLVVLLGIPIAYPRLVWLENVLTSRAIEPLKALSRLGIKADFVNSFDGGVELLDDLDDHWTAISHKAERNILIKRLQEFAAEHSIRVTVLGGDVHLAGIGRFMSNPKLKLHKLNDPRYIPNVISSAIVNAPPPDRLADLLNKRNKIHHLDDFTNEDMVPIFQTDVNGAARNNRRLLPRRNYLTIHYYEPNNTEPDYEMEPRTKTVFHKAGIRALFKSTKDKDKDNQPKNDLSNSVDGAAASTPTLDLDEVMRDGIQVALRVEINQRDPAGATKPYRFNIPPLRCDPGALGEHTSA